MPESRSCEDEFYGIEGWLSVFKEWFETAMAIREAGASNNRPGDARRDVKACARLGTILVDTDLDFEGGSLRQEACRQFRVVGAVEELLWNVVSSNDGKWLTDMGLEVKTDASLYLDGGTGAVDCWLYLPLNRLIAKEVVDFAIVTCEWPIFSYIPVGVDGEIDRDISFEMS
jgi:hypothetical protein